MGLTLTILGVGLLVAPEHIAQQFFIGLAIAAAGIVLAGSGK